MIYALIAISLDGKTLSEIERTEVVRNSNRLLIESLLEFPHALIQALHQQKQAQHKNALINFQVHKL